MESVSPRDIARLPQTRDRDEKVIPEERVPPVPGEVCGRVTAAGRP
jgi:hypothetical protein